MRFVQVYSGGGPLVTQWDAHDDLNSNHEKMCGHVDRPIAALLKDLKSRGLLDTTLVVWCSASSAARRCRREARAATTTRMATRCGWPAAASRAAPPIGSTDEFGLNALTDRVSVNDFHATILHLLGLEHERLTVRHNSRDERLTDVAGKVIRGILGLCG